MIYIFKYQCTNIIHTLVIGSVPPMLNNAPIEKLLPHYNNEIAILSLTANLNITDALAFNIPHYSVASIFNFVRPLC